MIDLLRERLKIGLLFKSKPETFGAPHHMSQALALVRKNFENPAGGLSSKTIAQSIMAFRKTGSLPTFLDAKYVCFGVGQPVDKANWRLMDNKALLQQLLDQVKSYTTTPRRFLKCYQGLLASYFGFPVYRAGTSNSGLENWRELRSFLGRELKTALQTPGTHSWLKNLSENQNLLTENPCNKYGNFLANGDDSEFKQVCRNLGVPSDSWLLEEAVMAQISATCNFNDSMFHERLNILLDVINNRTCSTLPERLAIRCIASMVIRYSECSSKPEHLMLRNTSIEKLGNPWLKRTSWDAHVGNEGARRMVDSWLKRHLITDFFALLSEDGAADKRRLQYWLRFEAEIEDMWFALGRYAKEHTGADYKEIRKLAAGRLLVLESNANPKNNAFILRLRDKVVVEFGIKGNACYIFNSGNVPFDLARRSVSCDRSQLKSPQYGTQMRHADTGSASWEENFDQWLCPKIGWRPPEPPAPVPGTSSNYHAPPVIRRPPQAPTRDLFMEHFMAQLQTFARDNRLNISDQRGSGGALWVNTADNITWINKKLTGWGFKYKSPRGWWKV